MVTAKTVFGDVNLYWNKAIVEAFKPQKAAIIRVQAIQNILHRIVEDHSNAIRGHASHDPADNNGRPVTNIGNPRKSIRIPRSTARISLTFVVRQDIWTVALYICSDGTVDHSNLYTKDSDVTRWSYMRHRCKRAFQLQKVYTCERNRVEWTRIQHV